MTGGKTQTGTDRYEQWIDLEFGADVFVGDVLDIGGERVTVLENRSGLVAVERNAPVFHPEGTEWKVINQESSDAKKTSDRSGTSAI